MYENFKDIGDMKLAMCYKHNEKNISEIKKDIADNLYETLKIEIDYDRMENTEKFYEGIQNFERYIAPETKKAFMLLFEDKKKMDQEIKKRQTNMLKDIGIYMPNLRVLEVMRITQGEHFHIFSDMIRYIKLYKKGIADRRPKNKRIERLSMFEEMEKKLKTTTLTILANNLGPCSN